MSQPLIKFVSQNHSDDNVDSHREYKIHRHTPRITLSRPGQRAQHRGFSFVLLWADVVRE